MTAPKNPLALIILDGFGYAASEKYSAINEGSMPFFFSLLKKYPWRTLRASGSAVGLPEHVVGNSSVGHLTIGAGRSIEQPLTQFNRMIADHTLELLPVIKNNFMHLARTGKTLHILGLISDGGVHSTVAHTQALMQIAAQYGVRKLIIHAILDGRDVPQQSAAQYLEKIDQTIASLSGKIDAEIGTLQGRLYAMDRNNNTDRLRRAYEVLINDKQQHRPQRWQDVLEHLYKIGIYDETIAPTRLTSDSFIQKGDGMVYVNIRADRGRELYHLLQQNHDLAFLVSGISYDNDTNQEAICTTPHADDTLNDYFQHKGIRIATFAESEKYAHVTYFFNGGLERTRPNELRVIIASENPTSFVNQPAMKAREITQAVLQVLNRHDAQFYLINYANADMVGHSGDLEATKKAVAVLDEQLEILYREVVIKYKGTLYITGDHGNAEDKKNNSPTHTDNPVYFVVVSEPPCSRQMLEPMKTLADIKEFIIRDVSYLSKT